MLRPSSATWASKASTSADGLDLQAVHGIVGGGIDAEEDAEEELLPREIHGQLPVADPEDGACSWT